MGDILGFVVLIGVVVFLFFQVRGLIKDFKRRKEKKAENVKNKQAENGKEKDTQND